VAFRSIEPFGLKIHSRQETPLFPPLDGDVNQAHRQKSPLTPVMDVSCRQATLVQTANIRPVAGHSSLYHWIIDQHRYGASGNDVDNTPNECLHDAHVEEKAVRDVKQRISPSHDRPAHKKY
jgi:hypothetical protein